jgi:hypothetical protein
MRLFDAVKSYNREMLHTAALLEDSSAGDPDNRRRLLERLSSSLNEHRSIDEDIIFPVFTAAEHRSALIERSRTEAEEIRKALDEVMQQRLDESRLKYDIASLTNRVRTYVAHETDELLAEADRLLPEDEEQALEEVAARRHARLAHRIHKH